MNHQQSYSGLKKVILIALLGMAFIKVEKVKQPIIGVSKKSISLGFIKANAQTVFSFKIYNWGNAKLKIDTIMANCNCAMIAFNSDHLNQDDSVNVYVKYQSNYVGEINQSIIIVSNSNTRIKELPVTGQIIRTE
jgi:Protein of unknown function (DUF1573)